MKKRPVMLIIMDGYGIAPASDSNAVSMAKKPNLDRIFSEFDTKQLNASGDAVGLPEGQMGNSEVGHMNIGAGRVVRQSLSRINYDIKTGEFFKNEAILAAVENAKKNNKKFHILGLCSDGGIHSHTSHIIAIAKLAHENGIKDVYYHAFMDGRDTSPTSGKDFLAKVIEEGQVKVATVGGRYYDAIILFLVSIGLVGSNITINIFADNDSMFNKKNQNKKSNQTTEIGWYTKMMSNYKYLFGHTYIYYNLASKDIGVPMDKIKLQKIQL
jgi:hypothetical protein